jgi:hypothetical protein
MLIFIKAETCGFRTFPAETCGFRTFPLGVSLVFFLSFSL